MSVITWLSRNNLDTVSPLIRCRVCDSVGSMLHWIAVATNHRASNRRCRGFRPRASGGVTRAGGESRGNRLGGRFHDWVREWTPNAYVRPHCGLSVQERRYSWLCLSGRLEKTNSVNLTGRLPGDTWTDQPSSLPHACVCGRANVGNE